MEPSHQPRHLYDEVRRLLCALLEREGVMGAVLLDRQGALVMHEGDEPLGDTEGLAARFLDVARATSGLGGEPRDRAPSWFTRDGRHGAWLAPAGLGLTLVIFWELEACSGLAWRVGEGAAAALKAMLEEPPQAEPAPPAPPRDAEPDDRGPIWE